MRIALAQLNPTVGDLEGNAARVKAAARAAREAGAQLVVAPELVISGYPPKDLLLREGFAHSCDQLVARLAQELVEGPAVVVGHPSLRGLPGGRMGNAASLLAEGRIAATRHKCLLPNYDVFDERRYFLPAVLATPVEYAGFKLGIHICEDAWFGEAGTAYHLPPENRQDPIEQLAASGARLLINLSASPFELDKPHRRTRLVERHAARHRLPFLFVNQVGGNDDLVFDGNSLVFDQAGAKRLQLAPFREDLAVVDWNGAGEVAPPPGAPSRAAQAGVHDRTRDADILDAIVLGLRDYAHKCGFSDCVLGLSGGIDSALACYVAASALGPKHVHGLAMPSRYSSDHSVADARQVAQALGIDFQVVPIEEVHRAFEAAPIIGADLASLPAGLADQNLQSRIRGAMVMVRSNRHGWLALATGNKSELAVGYCTLYGDMAGGFAVLADLFKRDVYSVARYVNEVVERREVIPLRSLQKAPSAELAPNQFDQDTLPPYPVLDAILEGLIEKELSVASLSRQFPEETVRWVARRLDRNEFKRRQMPPGIKLSSRAFGSGRRMPMAARFD